MEISPASSKLWIPYHWDMIHFPHSTISEISGNRFQKDKNISSRQDSRVTVRRAHLVLHGNCTYIHIKGDPAQKPGLPIRSVLGPLMFFEVFR